MAEMGTEPDPESTIWRLTGSRVLVLGIGSEFGVLTPSISVVHFDRIIASPVDSLFLTANQHVF